MTEEKTRSKGRAHFYRALIPKPTKAGLFIALATTSSFLLLNGLDVGWFLPVVVATVVNFVMLIANNLIKLLRNPPLKRSSWDAILRICLVLICALGTAALLALNDSLVAKLTYTGFLVGLAALYCLNWNNAEFWSTANIPMSWRRQKHDPLGPPRFFVVLFLFSATLNALIAFFTTDFVWVLFRSSWPILSSLLVNTIIAERAFGKFHRHTC